MDIFNKKIIIATHYLVYGASQALREYLINNKIKKLIFIAHPLKIDETQSYVENIINGKVQNEQKTRLKSKIPVFNYLLETYLTLRWALKEKEKFDLFVGVDCLNAFTGIILKKLNKVKKVIFYTIDYVPKRFDYQILNNIYHWVGKFCVKNADEVWNVSPRIAEGREKIRGLKQNIYNKQKVVPIGVWFDRVRRLPFDKIEKHQLLFVGHLLEKQGVQLVLDSTPEIIKSIPDFHFLIIGGGEYEETLKKKTSDLGIEKYVTFTGWIKDRSKLDQIMADSALAIAMYDKEKDRFTYYADPTKLKDYLSAGLPVLLTDVPHNAKEIQKRNCGLIVKPDSRSIANAVIDLIKNEEKLKQYRENAANYAKQFDWNIIFRENLERVLL